MPNKKRCSRCRRRLLRIDFSENKKTFDGKHTYCNKCRSELYQERRNRLKGEFRCASCGGSVDADRLEKKLKECKKCASRTAAFVNARNKARIADGLCGSCGKPRDKNGTKAKCRPCADRFTAYATARVAAKQAAGLCLYCTSPAVARDLCRTHYMRVTAGNITGDRSNAAMLESIWAIQNGKCALTGWPLGIGNGASIDHIVPRSQGGKDVRENLRWTYGAVNLARSTMTDEEFIGMCRAVVAHADRPRDQAHDASAAEDMASRPKLPPIAFSYTRAGRSAR